MTRSPFDLHGRRALVTGAASGIGRAIAVGLARAGCDLVLSSARDDLSETATLVAETGVDSDRCLVDLSRPDDVGPAVSELLGRYRIDVLVNAAGVIHRDRVVDLAEETWRHVLEVNLHAAFLLSRAVAPAMLRRGTGKVINVASMLSFQGGSLVAPYTASKHALVGLTKACANEWARHNVQVNAVAPGYVATRTTEALRADPQRSREILSRIPAGRWGEPEDISGAATFLASPASDYVTGHVLAVDGGWLSW